MNKQKAIIASCMLVIILVVGYAKLSWFKWYIRETARQVVIEELDRRGFTLKAEITAVEQPETLPLRTPSPTFVINDVIDADTIKVDVQLVGDVWLKNASMRVANVDAIELTEPKGKEAAAWVREFVAQPGCEVLIEKKRDKYGRLLGDVRHNGKYLSDMLLEKNYAKPYND